MNKSKKILVSIACLIAIGTLGACRTYEDVPPQVADAQYGVPTAMQKPFNTESEIIAATNACIRSEIEGPKALRSLLDRGYAVIKSSAVGDFAYAKSESRETASLTGLFGAVKMRKAIYVSDKGSNDGCQIDISRQVAENGFKTVQVYMLSQGFKLDRSGYGRSTYTKDGRKWMVSGQADTKNDMSSYWITRN